MVRYRVSNWASLWKAINQQKRQFNGHLQDLWKAKSPEKGLSRDLNIFFELFKDHLFLLGLFHAGFHNGNVDLQLISGRSICEWDQDGLIVLLANVISDAIKKKIPIYFDDFMIFLIPLMSISIISIMSISNLCSTIVTL